MIEETQRSTARSAAPFLEWLDDWYRQLPPVSLGSRVLRDARPEHVAVLVVDLLVGFCSEGPLASPRVAVLGPKAAAFLSAAREAGIRQFLLAADAHPEDSPEFAAFPPHCVAGSRQAEAIEELTRLPFYAELAMIPKRSLNVGLEPAFAAWRDAHPDIRSWIVLGDCTDLCVYQAAMHLRLQANAEANDVTVWVPADLVDTYDLSVAAAGQVGGMPHDGDLLHRLFLFHMALNGIRVVREITA